MDKSSISDILLYSFLVVLVFNHLVVKYFLLRRLRIHHVRVWQRLGCPGVFRGRDPHWTLAGCFQDFSLCAELGSDEPVRVTRLQVYGYRVLSVVEAALLIGGLVAIYTGR